MLYAILKPVMKAALRLYFGRIVVSGMAHIDNGRPTLILANHTASFMDAVITACFVKRRIHFFTRGDVFKYRLADKILRSLGMLPVYRLRDGRDKLQLNDSSNEEALKILAKGGAVLIFAEGESNIAKVLKPLKKGPFRLAATAAETLAEAPVLVPLGINYVTPAAPFGDVFLNAAVPLNAADFTSNGADAAAAKAATDMMRATAVALSPLVWHIAHTGSLQLGNELLAMLKEVHPGYSFGESQRLLKHLNSADDAARAGLHADWVEYHIWERQHPVGEAQSRPLPRPAEWLLALVGLPVVAIGYFSHILFIRAAKNVADRRVSEPDFWAPVFLSGAVICVSLFYILWTAISFLSYNPWKALLIMGVMAMSGVFYLKIYRPLGLKVAGVWQRAAYRRQNPSYPLVRTLRQSLLRFVRMALD